MGGQHSIALFRILELLALSSRMEEDPSEQRKGQGRQIECEN